MVMYVGKSEDTVFDVGYQRLTKTFYMVIFGHIFWIGDGKLKVER